MEKYVLPQNNNSDFKFPAFHLPLQQIRRDKSQFSMPQLGDASVFRRLPPAHGRGHGQFDQPAERRKTSRPASYRLASRAGCREEREILMLSNSLKVYMRVSNKRAGTLKSKYKN